MTRTGVTSSLGQNSHYIASKRNRRIGFARPHQIRRDAKDEGGSHNGPRSTGGQGSQRTHHHSSIVTGEPCGAIHSSGTSANSQSFLLVYGKQLLTPQRSA